MAGAVPVARFGYQIDARRKITWITDFADAANHRAFSYDANGHLLTASGPWGAGGAWSAGSYVYDALGNIRARTEGVSAATIAYDAATNRVSTTTVDAVPRAYAYDARGNTIADGLRTFAYDRANQPTSVAMGGTHA